MKKQNKDQLLPTLLANLVIFKKFNWKRFISCRAKGFVRSPKDSGFLFTSGKVGTTKVD